MKILMATQKRRCAPFYGIHRVAHFCVPCPSLLATLQREKSKNHMKMVMARGLKSALDLRSLPLLFLAFLCAAVKKVKK